MAFVSSPNLLSSLSVKRSRRHDVCDISMVKRSPKTPKDENPKKAADSLQPDAESLPPKPPSPEEMLLKDLEAMRARRKNEPQVEKKVSPLAGVKSAIDTLLLMDFFLVVALLGWLAVALIPHFATKNDVLLDPWLGLWQPFIQPVLGVLMLGTVVQGTISFINSKD